MNEINRNAPCPCGSGKKYKKCCMGQDLERKHRHRKQGGFGFDPSAYNPARGREILKKASITKATGGSMMDKLAPKPQESQGGEEEKNTESTE